MVCFQPWWLQLKNGTPVFLKKVFVFQEICLKVKVWKMFETFTGCHIKICRSLKWSPILKISSTAFLEELMLVLLALKWKL